MPLAIQMSSDANRVRAAPACLASSPVSSRTTILVSTSIMTTHRFRSYRSVHPRDRFWFVVCRQAPRYIGEIGGAGSPPS